MRTRAYIICICFFFSSQITYAQLNPWWLEQTTIDSAELKRNVVADSVIHYAKTFIGVPYVWGGTDPHIGFDCSGFICYVYKKYGVELPRTSDLQFNAGKPIAYNEAQPGDLILFTGREAYGGEPGHVGIVLSYDEIKGFTFIHTSSETSGGVRISNELGEKYYYTRFLEIRRVIGIN